MMGSGNDFDMGRGNIVFTFPHIDFPGEGSEDPYKALDEAMTANTDPNIMFWVESKQSHEMR
jgi:hypothetical protein